MCGEDPTVSTMKAETAVTEPPRQLRSIAQLRCDFWRRQTASLATHEPDELHADNITTQESSPTSSSSKSAEPEPKLRTMEELMSKFQQQRQAKPVQSMSEASQTLLAAPMKLGVVKDYASTAAGSYTHSESPSSEPSTPRATAAAGPAPAPPPAPAPAPAAKKLSADAVSFFPEAGYRTLAS